VLTGIANTGKYPNVEAAESVVGLVVVVAVVELYEAAVVIAAGSVTYFVLRHEREKEGEKSQC
jgi:hypothetical protein